MARSLNSQCNFENGFFSCDLPEDAILLILKVKTKTGNHTLVEDTGKADREILPMEEAIKRRETISPKTSRSLNSKEK